jgi:hypothetical protein
MIQISMIMGLKTRLQRPKEKVKKEAAAAAVEKQARIDRKETS